MLSTVIKQLPSQPFPHSLHHPADHTHEFPCTSERMIIRRFAHAVDDREKPNELIEHGRLHHLGRLIRPVNLSVNAVMIMASH
jgi:hypothetical protein